MSEPPKSIQINNYGVIELIGQHQVYRNQSQEQENNPDSKFQSRRKFLSKYGSHSDFNAKVLQSSPQFLKIPTSQPFASDNSAPRVSSPVPQARPSFTSQSRGSFKNSIDEAASEEEDLNWLEGRRLEQVRTFINMFQTINLVFQIDAVIKLDSLPTVLKWLQPLYYAMFLAVLVLQIQSYRSSINYIYSALMVLTWRNLIPLLNIENSVAFGESHHNGIYLMITQVCACLYSITLIASLNYRFKVAWVTVLSLLVLVGIINNLYTLEELKKQYPFVILMSLATSLFQWIFISHQIKLGEDVHSQFVLREKQKKEFKVILDNQQEGIIIYQQGTVTYCNPFCISAYEDALTIDQLKQIQKPELLIGQMDSLAIFAPYEMSTYKEDRQSLGAKEEKDQLTLKEVLDDDRFPDRHNRVFCMNSFTKMEQRAQSSSGLSEHPEEAIFRFVQIKKKAFLLENTEHLLIQIIDISNSVLYDQAEAKNELLALINVTVSHEMRNPLNSIIAMTADSDYTLSKFGSAIQSFKRESQSFLAGESSQRGNLKRSKTIQPDTGLGAESMSVQKDEVSAFCEKTQAMLQHFHGEFKRIASQQNSSSKLLMFFVNDIIDFSKIRTGKFSKEKKIKKFNLVSAVNEVIDILAYQAKTTKINIRSQYQQLDAFQNIVSTDRQRLQQILLNLVQNALKFTKEGGKVTIKARPYYQDGHWFLRIQVRDTGVGMTSREKKKLFKLFGVLRNTRQQNSKGIGLDLVICKLIAQEFGGELEVVSKKGVGSLFSFSMRLYDKHKPDEMFRPTDLLSVDDRDLLDENQAEVNDEESSSSDGSGDTGSLTPSSPHMQTCLAGMESVVSKQSRAFTPEKKRSSKSVMSSFPQSKFKTGLSRLFDKQPVLLSESDTEEAEEEIPYPRILITDDYAFNIEAICIQLKILGIDVDRQVQKALNGLQAVEKVLQAGRTNYFHIIFMDCNMPQMDGYQATMRIREHFEQEGLPQPHIFAVTGHTEDQYLKQALDSGMNQVFSKPIVQEQIKEVVENVGRLILRRPSQAENLTEESLEISKVQESMALHLIAQR